MSTIDRVLAPSFALALLVFAPPAAPQANAPTDRALQVPRFANECVALLRTREGRYGGDNNLRPQSVDNLVRAQSARARSLRVGASSTISVDACVRPLKDLPGPVTVRAGVQRSRAGETKTQSLQAGPAALIRIDGPLSAERIACGSAKFETPSPVQELWIEVDPGFEAEPDWMAHLDNVCIAPVRRGDVAQKVPGR